MISCNNYTKDDHPEYFSRLFYRFDTTANEKRAKEIILLDAAFHKFHKPGIGDKIELYKRKYEYNIDVVKDYNKAFLYADSMQILAENRIKDQRFAIIYAGAIFKKGDVYSFLKNYDESIRYYSQGKLFVTNNLKDKCELAGYNGRIANLIFRQGRYILAAGYYREGYEEEQSCQKDPFLKYVYGQGNLNNVGICYYRAGMLDSADFYFRAAMDFINIKQHDFPEKTAFTKVAKAVINANFARLEDKKGSFNKAEILYKSSINDSRNDDADYTRRLNWTWQKCI